MKDDTEEGTVDFQAPVVINEAEGPELIHKTQSAELCGRTLRSSSIIDPQMDDATTMDAGRDVLAASESGATRNRGRPQAVGTLHGVVPVAIPSCRDRFVVNWRGSSSERRFCG